jgi:hypothetical protein
MGDLNKTLAPGTATLRVSGVRKDGGSANLASVVFSVESGTATLAAGQDFLSQVITVVDANPTVIKVDANADLMGGSRIITARLFLIGGGVGIIPDGEAVSLALTIE